MVPQGDRVHLLTSANAAYFQTAAQRAGPHSLVHLAYGLVLFVVPFLLTVVAVVQSRQQQAISFFHIASVGATTRHVPLNPRPLLTGDRRRPSGVAQGYQRLTSVRDDAGHPKHLHKPFPRSTLQTLDIPNSAWAVMDGSNSWRRSWDHFAACMGLVALLALWRAKRQISAHRPFHVRDVTENRLHMLSLTASAVDDAVKKTQLVKTAAYEPEEYIHLAESRNPEHLDFPLEPVMLRTDLTFDKKMESVSAYWNRRPLSVAKRISAITVVLGKVLLAYRNEDKNKEQILKQGIVSLGVVFVKMAQTMATRPDIIGDEAAKALSTLQDNNPPFPDSIAYKVIQEDLNWAGPVSPHHKRLLRPGTPEDEDNSDCLFAELSETSIAAASIAQVYKGRTWAGVEVAVKVRRPGVVRQVSLDNHCIRLLLASLKSYGVLSEQTDISCLTEEVGSGLFRELDLMQEAGNAEAFAKIHSRDKYLRVPRHVRSLTSTRVLTQEFIKGNKITDLKVEDQESMICMGLDTCFTQMLRTGFIHADPHYGNMMFTHDGNLALLDFGLVTSATPVQKDAMAQAVLHTLSENWAAMIDDFKSLEMIPNNPSIWVDRKTKEPISGLEPGEWKHIDQAEFISVFVGHLYATGEAAALKNNGARRSFSQLTQDLYLLSLQYRFVLPSWMIFIIRAVITLDGFAAQISRPVNAVEAAFPHAVRRILTPSTAAARQTFMETLLTPDGDLQWKFLEEVAVAGTTSADSAVAPDQRDTEPVQRLMEVLRELIYCRRDGAFLRRLTGTLNSPAIIRHFMAEALGQLRHGPSPQVERQLWNGVLAALYMPVWILQALNPFSREKRAPRPAEETAPTDPPPPHARPISDGRRTLTEAEMSLSPLPKPPPPPTPTTKRRIRKALIQIHIRKILASPSAVLCILAAPLVITLLLLRVSLQGILFPVRPRTLKSGWRYLRRSRMKSRRTTSPSESQPGSDTATHAPTLAPA
uniref:ABC1 atypical kinase-like domain-containing protein n=1 Tax=Eutreptiella gymnastica TaxID=73025 RepID=A0A7S1JGU2_9EUGL